MTGGVDRAHPLGHGHAQPKRRVHRHRDQDHPGSLDALGVEGLDGDVHDRRPVALALEKRGRPGNGQGLVAELVAGHEEDGAGFLHTQECTPAVVCWWALLKRQGGTS